MLNPIKRIWAPKKTPVETPATQAAQTVSPKKAATQRSAGGRGGLFDELPSPEMEEKNSDSVWAEFDSVHKPEIERK